MMALNSFYFTFGQAHRHLLGEVVFDKDCVCKILATHAARAERIAFDAFGRRWARRFDRLDDVGLEYYPRGVISLND